MLDINTLQSELQTLGERLHAQDDHWTSIIETLLTPPQAAVPPFTEWTLTQGLDKEWVEISETLQMYNFHRDALKVILREPQRPHVTFLDLLREEPITIRGTEGANSLLDRILALCKNKLAERLGDVAQREVALTIGLVTSQKAVNRLLIVVDELRSFFLNQETLQWTTNDQAGGQRLAGWLNRQHLRFQKYAAKCGVRLSRQSMLAEHFEDAEVFESRDPGRGEEVISAVQARLVEMNAQSGVTSMSSVKPGQRQITAYFKLMEEDGGRPKKRWRLDESGQ